MSVTVDLTRNPNQANFFHEVMFSIARKSKKRIFAYGGAIRGGKTFICLFILTLLCKKYPKSRWHVIREDMPALKATSIPSMEKIIGNSSKWRWSRNPSDYYAEYENGSRIFFMGQSIDRDPELNKFLGLETNGMLLEQCEELKEKLFNIALSRCGSWYIPDMPTSIMMLTFNPTQTWVKQKIYVPWVKGELPSEYHFQHALPNDNPFVTHDQWDGWKMMDQRYYSQFIKGDWTDFNDMNNRWAFAFDRKKHIGSNEEGFLYAPPKRNNEEPIYLSWDFNRNPLCCSVIQWYKGHVYFLKTYKIPNTGVDEICERIKVDYPNALFIITGDYSGNNASTLFADTTTNYSIIRQKLNLSRTQIKIIPNPKLAKNRNLFNSLLSNYPITFHEFDAAAIIWDMENVKALADGTIEKLDRKDPAQQADALDTGRYFFNRFMSDFIKLEV